MIFVDTDVMIDYQRGLPAARDWFGSLTELPAIPGFVAMELVQDALNMAQVRQIESVLKPLTIVWPSEDECNVARANFSKLNRSHGIGLIDSLIAATAVGRGVVLCTFNTRHYRGFPGIVLQEPYRR